MRKNNYKISGVSGVRGQVIGAVPHRLCVAPSKSKQTDNIGLVASASLVKSKFVTVQAFYPVLLRISMQFSILLHPANIYSNCLSVVKTPLI